MAPRKPFIFVAAVLILIALSTQLFDQVSLLLGDKEDEETNHATGWRELTIETLENKAEHGYKDTKHDLGKGIDAVNTHGWVNILTHEDFPSYDIRLKEPTLCDPSVKQYSGYLDAGEKKHFFFWFFESRNNPATDPIVLWLNGGPGCSSLTGLFFELGPCTVNDEGDGTSLNPYSWNNNASVIFLDQPVNVGYSHGSGVSNTPAAAKDVYAFLQIFFKHFPAYAKLDFHIAGESYAGHYIPVIAAEINNNNKGTSAWIQSTKPKHIKHINLDSVMIGNGLVDPLVQYKYFPDMACNSTYKSVLDERTCDSMRDAYPRCRSMIKSCYDSPNVFTCLPASIYCNREMIGPYQSTGQNPYDVRKKCEDNNLCYSILKAIEAYLNKKHIMAELGAEVDGYKSCNMDINLKFLMAGDWMRPFHLELPPLLASNIRVIIYAGDADFICNWMGNFAWVNELEWHGKKKFNSAHLRDWVLEDGSEIAGKVRSFKGLTWLQVYEAGHMVPYDQPKASLDFFNRWIQKRNI